MQVETHFVPTILASSGIQKYTLAMGKPTFKFDEISIFQNVVKQYCFTHFSNYKNNGRTEKRFESLQK